MLATGSPLGLGAGAWWLLQRAPGGAAPQRPATLAVLPIRPLMTDGRDELLELGMADALIGRLSAVPGLAVRSVGSVLCFGGTRNTDAYQLYLTALRYAQDLRGDNLTNSITLFNEALTIDPAYALASVGLAEAPTRTLFGADALPSQVAELADLAVRRALALAPRLAEAHIQNGTNRQWYDFDWPEAEGEYRVALAANPNAFGAHFGLANLMLTQDRIEEGFEHLRLARELSPLSPLVNTLEAGYLLDAGRFDPASLRLARALDLATNFWLAHIVLGHFHLARQRIGEGLAALRKAVKLAQASTQSLSTLGMHLARAGQRDEARLILKQLLEREKSRYVPPTSLAAVQSALGRPARGAAIQGPDGQARTRPLRARTVALLSRCGAATAAPVLRQRRGQAPRLFSCALSPFSTSTWRAAATASGSMIDG